MGIDGNVPAQIEADDDVQDYEGPEPRGAEVQIETDVEEDKKEGDMEEDPRKAIGSEALGTGKGPCKVCTISF
jgi:hypothetical protein